MSRFLFVATYFKNVLSKYGILYTSRGLLLMLLFVIIFFELISGYGNQYILLSLGVIYIVLFLKHFFYSRCISFKPIKIVKDNESWIIISDLLFVMIFTILVFVGFIIENKVTGFKYIDNIIKSFLFLMIVVIAFRFKFFSLYKKIRHYDNNIEGQLSRSNKITKLNNAKFSEEKSVKYTARLKKELKNKIYLRTDLTLDFLAYKTKIPTDQLSQLFARKFKSNFNQVINSYRIRYAAKILDDNYNKQTIEEISKASGFSSKSSFYRAFNIAFKMTPSEYRKHKKDNT